MSKKDIHMPTITNKSSLTSVLQDMLEPVAQTVEKKLQTAIREIGIYHPRLNLTYEQIQALQDAGLVRSLSKAVEAYGYASAINPTSVARPWTNLRKAPSYHVYRMWKVAGGEGKTKVKTPYDLMSERNINPKTLNRVSKILGLHQNEPIEGRVWPPLNDPGAAAPVDVPESPISMAALAETVEVAPPKVEVPRELTPPPEPPRMERPSSVPVTTRTDLKELLLMLNEALLQANVSSIHVKPGKEGPTYELEQVVIRKLTSLDELL